MIPKNWEDRDFYKELKVDKTASFSVIRAAYRELIKSLHPDINQSQNQNDELLRVNEAFTVLADPNKRALYDQYVGGPEQVFVNQPLMAKPRASVNSKLLSRSLLFIVLALLVRNMNYPAIVPATAVNPGQNSSSTPTTGVSDPNFNQTLVLIAGPQGAPGVAGVSGKDGFVGLNGYQGSDGIAGATGAPGARGAPGAAGVAGAAGAAGGAGAAGAAGVAGAGVVIVSLAVDDANCALGGTKFISTTGTVSYACNGGSGASLGSGFVSIGSCDPEVRLTLQSNYTGGDFMMAGVTLSELSGLCNNQTVSIYLNVKAVGAGVEKFGTANTYQLADVIICTQVLSITPGSATNTVVLGTAHCTNQNTAGTRANFVLGDMSARDMKDGERAIAIQISG
ncbi:MAG: DnaJ domain-containing protein [Candidatus Nanopelagicus sp.]|nr:DnaJ domain-containing protein [Candidatus Nanopelagicus sp.]